MRNLLWAIVLSVVMACTFSYADDGGYFQAQMDTSNQEAQASQEDADMALSYQRNQDLQDQMDQMQMQESTDEEIQEEKIEDLQNQVHQLRCAAAKDDDTIDPTCY